MHFFITLINAGSKPNSIDEWFDFGNLDAANSVIFLCNEYSMRKEWVCYLYVK